MELYYNKKKFHTKLNYIKCIDSLIDLIEEYDKVIFSCEQILNLTEKKLMRLNTSLPSVSLNIKIQQFYSKFYNTKCRAFTIKGIRCRNKMSYDISKYFCKTHRTKYIQKIINIFNYFLPNELSILCINYYFYEKK